MQEVAIQTTGVFNKNWNSTKKIMVNRGGTRAGKTYSIMQIFAVWLMTGKIRANLEIKDGVASVVRKTLPSLKATAQKDFEEILTKMGAYTLVEVNKTDRFYKYEGRVVEFFSVDDAQKVRGRKRNILFCNEANELNFKTDFFQLLMRTSDLIFIDLNPSDPYTWVNTKIEQERYHTRGDVDVLVSTHKDNPFLTEEQHREIESISDPQLRKVYVDGEYGIVKGLVFPKVTIVDRMPDGLRKEGVGLDFGFTNDPTAAMHCGILGKKLYINEIFYRTGMFADEIAAELPSRIPVYCDAQDPRLIKTIARTGVWAQAAKKGKGSIDFGIGLIKQYEICITVNSVNLLKEQKQYKYKVLPDGTATNKPIDQFNHGWDAVRYWAMMAIGQQKQLLSYG